MYPYFTEFKPYFKFIILAFSLPYWLYNPIALPGYFIKICKKGRKGRIKRLDFSSLHSIPQIDYSNPYLDRYN